MGRLKAIRTSLRKQLRSEEVHEFARIVEELGYADYRSVEREKADFAGRRRGSPLLSEASEDARGGCGGAE
jgi:hypothetical protein